MKIKNIEIKNKVMLAPMAGINDVGFRKLCLLNGADYAVTEMISAKAIKYNSKKTFDMLKVSDVEKIKVVQIFGSEPDVMGEICKSEHLSHFDIIDINMGCPANKIVSNSEGSALMKDIELASEIVKACVNATDKPITVKFRLGWDGDSINAVEFAQMCERSGASAITVHGRTRMQAYGGKSDLDMIKKVKQSVSIPVIGNGDVIDKASFEYMLNYTGCDAVMIGRGSHGKPEVFSEVLGLKPAMSKYDMICEHVKELQKYHDDDFIVKHMRKHFLWYLNDIKFSSEIKTKLVTINDLSEVLTIIKNAFN